MELFQQRCGVGAAGDGVLHQHRLVVHQLCANQAGRTFQGVCCKLRLRFQSLRQQGADARAGIAVVLQEAAQDLQVQRTFAHQAVQSLLDVEALAYRCAGREVIHQDRI